jgi:hypothetical protein
MMLLFIGFLTYKLKIYKIYFEKIKKKNENRINFDNESIDFA